MAIGGADLEMSWTQQVAEKWDVRPPSSMAPGQTGRPQATQGLSPGTDFPQLLLTISQAYEDQALWLCSEGRRGWL